MSKEDNNEISARFSISLISLLAKKEFENKAEIATFLGCTPQVLSEILKGRMQVQPYMLQKMFLKHPKVVQYVLTGKEFNAYEASLNGSSMASEPPIEYNVVHRKDDVVHRLSMDEWMRNIEARLIALETNPKP